MAEPIMIIHAIIDPKTITRVEGKNSGAIVIPFTGDVRSDLFTGVIMPGGTDVQTINTVGVKHMCAKYVLSGKDYTGAECKIFVENNGYMTLNEVETEYFTTCPTFITDSEALAPYLMANHFRTEGHGVADGVEIRVFDTLKD